MPKLEDGKTDRRSLREKAKEDLKELTGEEAGHQLILEKLRNDFQSARGEYKG
jgi:hypothetical protein